MSEKASSLCDTAEGKRLFSPECPKWRRFGPYVSDRQWGTVREDYSEGGTAWDSFPHEHARSRAYRWGEDGIGGFGDEQLNWCLSLALWNGKDAILKERLFGLANAEGNHGEDVKELYFYVDGLPSHAYMRMLYRYPHAAFPYEDLVEENARRDASQVEYEVLDTGVFDDDAFFDVVIEYAKHTPDDVVMQVSVRNRSALSAELWALPQVWARNYWSWQNTERRPLLRNDGDRLLARHPRVEDFEVTTWGDAQAEWLFCENDTNVTRLFGNPGAGPFKDGFNDYIVDGKEGAVRRDSGSKAGALRRLVFQPHETRTFGMRFRPVNGAGDAESAAPDAVIARRRAEADEFYAALQPGLDEDARNVQRQAFAGLLWSKQFYFFDVQRWLAGDPLQPPPPASRKHGRNADWGHLSNADVISMPDKWEYPWYASWDLAFHAVTFALIDPDFAKKQLALLLQDRFMHPNGQMPAYEWAFGDANPPVHAWAVWRVYEMDLALTGTPDRVFLERSFHKLLLNFGWWVNRKDAEGRNVFQGGFLGLDNIELFDRSAPLPTGGRIDQSDGTAWMAGYALNLMRIALELAVENPIYVDIAVKFFEHFLYIAEAMAGADDDGIGLWDEQDEFFYDVLRLPNGKKVPLRVRTAVGLIPLFAVHVLEDKVIRQVPRLVERLAWFMRHRPALAKLVSRWNEPNQGMTLLSLLRGHRMKALLRRALDEAEFLSDYGVRSLSRSHAHSPFVLEHDNQPFGIGYWPAESESRLFGGNSNWRGPIWMPINYLLVESLYEFHRYYGDDFRVEYPTNSGKLHSLAEIADSLAGRLSSLFLKNREGRRPVMAAYPLLECDPEASDLVLFHEYFHGDNGRGVGASHQTGWTSLVALLLQPRRMTASANLPVGAVGSDDDAAEQALAADGNARFFHEANAAWFEANKGGHGGAQTDGGHGRDVDPFESLDVS
ncbi:MGH1-like glycoside hydrolase domain-containing protein [Chitinasiproducens palmae]|uniref:mannosyl-oligosaccharide glucosidase n=1 Tax=Chitinasiproducens palmae TaxID=1770053 RepID=A0A1H2PS60_9BURK|nr:glucosidase [Chitinasiproducens palmae]SDV49760.1 Glycosyl hydrolase family 63 C-terminal domain-containing protein [Chitinasiproducens palmae]